MREYKRLTKQDNFDDFCENVSCPHKYIEELGCSVQDCDNCYYNKIYTRLAELEDKIESENSFCPKFSIYENVFIIDYVDENNYSLREKDRDDRTKIVVRECFVTYISQYSRYEYLYRVQPHDLPKEILEDSTIHDEYWDRSLGDMELFKTKESAEVRLKELQEGKK